MLEIIVSNTLNSAAQAVIDKLGEYDSEDVSHVVIVPDRFTMSVETEIFSRLNLSGAFNVEVVSFTRLAVKKLKGKCRKALTKEGAVVLLGEVAKGLSEELEYFSEPDKKRGLMRDLYAVIASIRTSGIGADELFSAFSDGKDRISRKYRDLARLYKAYDERVREAYSDTVTRLQLFLSELPNMPDISNVRVYALGFRDFTAVELSVLRALERSAKSVTVGMADGFSGASNGLSNKRAISRVRNIDPTARVIKVEKELDAATAEIVRHTYGYGSAEVRNGGSRFVPFSENTPYDEVNAVAKQILSHIDEGKRFKDIAVVFCDDCYKSIIKDVFARYGVPVFIDEKYPLKNTVLARLLLSGLSAAAKGAERSAFLAFAKNPLLGIPYSQIEELENFILKNNLNYSKLLEPFDKRLKDYSDDAEETRKTVADRLPDIKKTDTAKGYAASLSEFLTAAGGGDGTLLFGENSVCRDATLEELNAQSLDRILEQTDEIATIIGDRIMDAKELLAAVTSAIDSVDVSLIPDAIDSVFAGSTDDSPFFDKKIMFVIGAAAGRFPRESGWQAILSERDAEAIFAKGFDLYPTPVDKLKSDKLAVLDLLTKADEKVYIGCPSYSADGIRQTPSEAFRQIAKAVRSETARLSDNFSIKQGFASAVKGLGSVKNAAYELLKAEAAGTAPEAVPFYAALRKRLEELGAVAPRGGINDGVSDICLFEKTDGKKFTSVSRVETYMSCPYKYFLRYGLSVRPRDEGEVRVPDLGNVLHRILELVFKRLKGHFRVATDAEISEITAKAADETFADINYVPPNASENNPVVFGNLRREADETVRRLVSFVRAGKYEPTYFEVRFGDGSRSVSVETSVGTVGITGKIDRVDELSDKIVVMDYKTGATKGIADFKNLYYGKHIQLYVYPAAFRTDGKKVTGAYYVPISGDYRSENAAGKRFEGKTSELWADVKELDGSLDPYGKTSSDFLPVDLSVKNGEIVYKKPDNMLSSAEFSFCEDYALKTVARAVDAMAEGFIGKIPLATECKYCEFANVCGEVPERKATSVKLADGAFSVTPEEDEDE